MKLDPNWFYSSLAQSGAALVGLMGAILATRLQEQVVVARAQREKLDGILAAFGPEFKRLYKALLLYLEHVDRQHAILRESIPLGTPSIQCQVWYAPFEQSAPAVVENTERMLQIDVARKRAALAAQPILAEFADKDSIPAAEELAAALTRLQAGLSGELDGGIQRLVDLSGAASREGGILEARAATTGGWILWWSMLLICATGVLAPLLFLTALSTVHKVSLLLPFAMALALLLCWIAAQLVNLGRVRTVASLVGKS